VKGSSLDAVWMANVPDHERTSTAYDNMDFAPGADLTGAGAVYALYRAFCRNERPAGPRYGALPRRIGTARPGLEAAQGLRDVAATRPWAYTGIPRERRLRLPYLPPEMRQGALFQKAAPEQRKKDFDAGVSAAVAAVQGVFGLDDTEEVAP
jgi:hypothetical protein